MLTRDRRSFARPALERALDVANQLQRQGHAQGGRSRRNQQNQDHRILQDHIAVHSPVETPRDAIIIGHGMVNFRERYCWPAFGEGSQRKTAFTRGSGADMMAA